MEEATDFSALANPMEKANIDYAMLANRAGADSFVYYFERSLPGDDSGAFHSAELWYVFGALDYCWRKDFFTDQDYELSAKIVKYWTNFMKNSDPNGNGLPKWDKCTNSSKVLMLG